jgi:hypothetical protein
LQAIQTLLQFMLQQQQQQQQHNHKDDDVTDGESYCFIHLSMELQKRMDHLRLLLVVLGHSAEYLQTLATTTKTTTLAQQQHRHRHHNDMEDPNNKLVPILLVPTMEMDLAIVRHPSSSFLLSIATPAAQLSILLVKLQYITRLKKKQQQSSSSSCDKSTTNTPSSHNKDNNLENILLQQQISFVKQQLQDTRYQYVWKSFFRRGNHLYDDDHDHDDTINHNYEWGPDILDWMENKTLKQNFTVNDDHDHDDQCSSSSSSFGMSVASPSLLLLLLSSSSPTKDFYLWLQDFCFFDADLSEVVEEVLERNKPILKW